MNHVTYIENLERRSLFAGGPIGLIQAELLSVTRAQANAPVPQYQTVPTYNWNGNDNSSSTSIGSGIFSSAAIGQSSGAAEFLGTSSVTITARPQWQTVETHDWID